MKLTSLYGWIVGKKTAFVNSFGDNDQLRNQAESFWKHLDGGTMYFLIAFIAIAIICAWVYYKPYNELPHRHYRPRHWLLFGLLTVIITFLVTLAIAYLVAPPKIQGSLSIEIRIALANTLYSIGVYFLVSFVFCNEWLGKTNAYKLFKL